MCNPPTNELLTTSCVPCGQDVIVDVGLKVMKACPNTSPWVPAVDSAQGEDHTPYMVIGHYDSQL